MRGFKQAYDNIRNGERARVKAAIMGSNKWASRSLWHMKMTGERRLTPEEKKNVQAVFAGVGIDAKSGKPLLKSSAVSH